MSLFYLFIYYLNDLTLADGNYQQDLKCITILKDVRIKV